MATYWVEAGHGGTNSGTQTNPWLTIDQSMAGLADGDKVWVKATASYPEVVTIDGHQASWNDPIVIEGYTTTEGDGGQATIDGAATRASGIVVSAFNGNTNYVFKNFIIQDHTAAGVSLNNVDRFTWKNCDFLSNAGTGIFCGALHAFENCRFNDNLNDGVICQAGALFVGCEFFRNTLAGIDAGGAVFALFCTFFSNGSIAMDCGATNDIMTLMVNCTVDGDSKDSTHALLLNSSFRQFGAVINTIAYDCTTGIEFANEEQFISRNNLVNSNTANYGTGAGTYSGEVTTAPGFVNEVGGADLSLEAGSNALAKGNDAYDVNGSTQSMDIGAIQRPAAGGAGGGLLMPNKRGNKQ